MPIFHYPNASEGVQPRPNDHSLQANWREVARIIPPDSLPVNIFQVLEGLWRSCLPFPQQLAEISKLRVRHIVALTECREMYSDAKKMGLLPDNLTIHHSPYNQRHYLTFHEIIKLTRLIHELRQDGGVLVHCIAGMTRTGSVVSAYVSAVLNDAPADFFESGRGPKDLISRWFDFMTLSGSLYNSEHQKNMQLRSRSIEELSAKFGIPVPKFLRPRTFLPVLNINALSELVRHGDLGDIVPYFFTETIPSPISHQHRQVVLPGHSSGIEIPNRGELLTT